MQREAHNRAGVAGANGLVRGCASVHYGFTIEIYRFTHSFRTSPARPTYDARSRSIEDSKGRRRRQNESRCMKDS